MLYELKYTKKYDNGTPIKWFSDDYFDLAVWFHDNGDIKSFQLCYDKYHKSHALTWKEGKGFSHDKVDDGDTPGYHKRSPILLPDGEFPKDDIAKKFLDASREIEPDIGQFVYKMILSY